MSAKLDLFRHDHNLQDRRELVLDFIQFSEVKSNKPFSSCFEPHYESGGVSAKLFIWKLVLFADE